MALSKDDILNAIADMSVMQVVELVQAMEQKFGVSAAAAVAAAPAAAGVAAPVVEEKTEFNVIMTDVRQKRSKCDQDSSYHHGSGSERSERPGGGRAVDRQGRREQGQRRQEIKKDLGGRRRHCRVK